MTQPRLEMEAFIEAVQQEFALAGEIQPNSLLVAELGLDSLDLINLVTFSEELSDQLPMGAEFPIFVSVSDAYSYYSSLLGSASCHPQ